jgi:hypothetical protein
LDNGNTLISTQHIGIEEFLADYQGMSLAPSRGSDFKLKGDFSFRAAPKNGDVLADSFAIEILVHATFPNSLPEVREVGGRIPKDGKHHVNPNTSLCLGSPLRLLDKVHKKPNLVGFAEKCLVPFLYAVSKKLRDGGQFVFSELAHGEQGIVVDYIAMFGFVARCQVIQALELIGMKRRIANKKPCPCACGRRLGRCGLRLKINRFRSMMPRSWFKKHVADLGAGISYPTRK